MIFITLGSQKFQFDRLLKEVDRLIADGVIQEKVFAQIGASEYLPQNYTYERFLDRQRFAKIMDQCDSVITHGGTGVIIGAVKKGKKVIAVPRLAKYGEHVDDHQLQLLHQFDDLQLICACYDVEQLGECYKNLQNMHFRPYVSNTSVVIASIDEYLQSLE
ncbi:MAG: beta(1,3)galactosyltransferase EpsH [Lachnospiraceae bacterium]|nr:beta(1,3)galactosyltransferase EpsH [Lachnospiraceae bacterium]